MNFFDSRPSSFDGDAYQCNFCHQKLRILRNTGSAAVVDPNDTKRILFATHAPCPELQRRDIQMNEEIKKQQQLERIEKIKQQEAGAKIMEEQVSYYRQKAFDSRMANIKRQMEEMNENKNDTKDNATI